MAYLTNLYWSIDRTTNDIFIIENNDNIKQINGELNEIILTIENGSKLKLPYHYLDENFYEIKLEQKKYSKQEILDIIYKFYNSTISEKEFEKLKNCIKFKYTMSSLEVIASDLIIGAISKKEKNNDVNRVDIMGSRVIFEGINKVNDETYEVLIGY
jgi:intergrase/recombinase